MGRIARQVIVAVATACIGTVKSLVVVISHETGGVCLAVAAARYIWGVAIDTAEFHLESTSGWHAIDLGINAARAANSIKGRPVTCSSTVRATITRKSIAFDRLLIGRLIDFGPKGSKGKIVVF